ncbi:MAG TPA: hypothetical protein VJT80_00345 [Steroidobacteraceae bacterium]|nr:hypothetical protein [Steroidobacteraceae bacterium]
MTDRLTVVLEEDVLVIDPHAEPLPALAQGELALQHLTRARTERDGAVLACLRAILVARHDARLRDRDRSLHRIAIADQQRDLLGRAQPREEAELVVVVLRLARVVMNGRDQCFRFLDRERINGRSILPAHAQRLQAACGIVAVRMIAIAVLEGASEDAHDVVVRLLAHAPCIRDLHEQRVLHLIEAPQTDHRAPNRIDHAPIACEGGIGQIELRKSCCAMREVRIEYIVARLMAEGACQTMLVAIVRKFSLERESATRDPRLDAPQLRAGALKIQFSRCCRDRRPIARSSIVEVELYSARTLRTDSAACR